MESITIFKSRTEFTLVSDPSLAIVESVIDSKDGATRAAIIRVVNTEGRSQLLKRSTKHLYPIEVSKNQSESTPADGDQESNVDDTDTRADTIRVRRSRRTAAATGELIRRITQN